MYFLNNCMIVALNKNINNFTLCYISITEPEIVFTLSHLGVFKILLREGYRQIRKR